MNDSAADIAVPVLIVLAVIGFLGLRHEMTAAEPPHASQEQSFAEMLEQEREAEPNAW